MRRRQFTMTSVEAAIAYAAYLIANGISFEVQCTTSQLNIITPFELKPPDFPKRGQFK